MKTYRSLSEEEAQKNNSKFCFTPYEAFAFGKAATIILFFVGLLFINVNRHVAVTGTCIAVIRFSIGDFIGRFIYGKYPLNSKKIAGMLPKTIKLLQIGLYGVSWFAFMEAIMLFLGFRDIQLLVSIAKCLAIVSAFFMVIRIERDMRILTNALKKHKIQAASVQKTGHAFVGSFFSLTIGLYAAAIMLLTRMVTYSAAGAAAVCIIAPGALFLLTEKLFPLKRRVKMKNPVEDKEKKRKIRRREDERHG